MNLQPIEKRSLRNDGQLDVHSIFGPTFQGEGPFAGTPCVFVRLAGCNLQCPRCDTIYTGPHRRLMATLEILNDVHYCFGGLKGKLVVISGGEPFRQNVAPLIDLLVANGFFVQVETNGTLAAPTPADVGWQIFNKDIVAREGAYIVCSPKAGKVHRSIEEQACAYKYVMSHDSVDADGLPNQVLDHRVSPKGVARPPIDFRGPVYLQPTDHSSVTTSTEDNAKSLCAVMKSCLTHGYILCLQLHKIIGVE